MNDMEAAYRRDHATKAAFDEASHALKKLLGEEHASHLGAADLADIKLLYTKLRAKSDHIVAVWN